MLQKNTGKIDIFIHAFKQFLTCVLTWMNRMERMILIFSSGNKISHSLNNFAHLSQYTKRYLI
jgi:hypothetical protein